MMISFTLNGEPKTLDVDPFRRAARLLAELGQEAVKTSCGIGRCGTCMILLDGKAVNACLLPAAKLDGAGIVTAEGLGSRADAIVAAMRKHGAIQCGYCAPGLLVSLVAAFEQGTMLEEADVEALLTGNLCRCSGYGGLRKAVRALVGR